LEELQQDDDPYGRLVASGQLDAQCVPFQVSELSYFVDVAVNAVSSLAGAPRGSCRAGYLAAVTATQHCSPVAVQPFSTSSQNGGSSTAPGLWPAGQLGLSTEEICRRLEGNGTADVTAGTFTSLDNLEYDWDDDWWGKRSAALRQLAQALDITGASGRHVYVPCGLHQAG
jgi:hypothetical protein